MAAKVEFYLGANDIDRLFAIKEDMGKTELTGNEFARELLEKELHRPHPQLVKYDEDGIRIKKEK